MKGELSMWHKVSKKLPKKQNLKIVKIKELIEPDKNDNSSYELHYTKYKSVGYYDKKQLCWWILVPNVANPSETKFSLIASDSILAKNCNIEIIKWKNL